MKVRICDRCNMNKAIGRLGLMVRDTKSKSNNVVKMRAIADICVPCFNVLWKDLRVACNQPKEKKK